MADLFEDLLVEQGTEDRGSLGRARRAEDAPAAGERDQVVGAAGVAVDAGEGSKLWLSPAVAAVLMAAAAGWIDEAIQFYLPSRIYDLRDVAFNALAGLLAVTAMVTLGWADETRGQGEESES